VDPVPYLTRRQMNAILAANAKPAADKRSRLIMNLELDPIETGMARYFLRRYLTWRARSRHWKSMNGAAHLPIAWKRGRLTSLAESR